MFYMRIVYIRNRRYQLPEKIFMQKKKWSHLKKVMIVGAAIFLIGAGFLLQTSAADKKSNSAEEMEKCAQCHEDVAKAFKTNGHNSLGAVCVDCHGNAEKHMAEGGALETIVTFKGKETAIQNTKQCLKCHKNSAAQYMAGPHGKASLDCTQCHSIHGKTKAKFLKAEESKLCSSCHQDIYSQFQLNERHRLLEGVLQCSSCHNVHEPATRERLGGFKQEACLKCHTDKGGPFLHEHLASRIEGCTVCHETHGSPNRHMLKHQNVAELCFSCHTEAPSWHSRFTTVDTNCVSCHSAIHGSNLDKLFLK
jgi:DmsE family decaheme c-type cytochrome